MALIIRLRQMGRTNRQTFRMVVADRRSPRDGKYVELLGWYNPVAEGANFDIKLDRVQYWLDNGALISDKSKAILKKVSPETVKKLVDRTINKKLKAKKKVKK